MVSLPFASICLARQLSPTSRGPLNIILTSHLSGVWLAFPPNIGVFCLHRRVFLAIGLIFTCGLATTLSVAIRWNIAVRPESICCVLVACGVKYVRLLVTTLGVAICCNTTIKPKSVRCVLVTYGQVFVCCLAITLNIVICCDTTIIPKFVCYLLTVIKLLPICRSCLR